MKVSTIAAPTTPGAAGTAVGATTDLITHQKFPFVPGNNVLACINLVAAANLTANLQTSDIDSDSDYVTVATVTVTSAVTKLAAFGTITLAKYARMQVVTADSTGSGAAFATLL
jgi:hypothetical protein